MRRADARVQHPDIYVTPKRRRTLDPKTIEQIAESMVDEGQRAPIMVREDGSH